MTLDQYKALKAVAFQAGGDKRNSALLRWLQLALNSASLNFGGTIQGLLYLLSLKGKSHLI